MPRVRVQRVADPKNTEDPAAVQRTLRDLVGRTNDLAKIFGEDSERSQADVLRGDMTWGRDAGTYLVPASAMQPTTPANWGGPSAAQDYYVINAGAGTGRHIAIPLLGLKPGMLLKTVILTFYRAAASDPSFSLVGAHDATAPVASTPAVAWTLPSATSAWQHLQATYNVKITEGNWQLFVAPANNGDRIRGCYFKVE